MKKIVMFVMFMFFIIACENEKPSRFVTPMVDSESIVSDNDIISESDDDIIDSDNVIIDGDNILLSDEDIVIKDDVIVDSDNTIVPDEDVDNVIVSNPVCGNYILENNETCEIGNTNLCKNIIPEITNDYMESECNNTCSGYNTDKNNCFVKIYEKKLPIPGDVNRLKYYNIIVTVGKIDDKYTFEKYDISNNSVDFKKDITSYIENKQYSAALLDLSISYSKRRIYIQEYMRDLDNKKINNYHEFDYNGNYIGRRIGEIMPKSETTASRNLTGSCDSTMTEWDLMSKCGALVISATNQEYKMYVIDKKYIVVDMVNYNKPSANVLEKFRKVYKYAYNGNIQTMYYDKNTKLLVLQNIWVNVTYHLYYDVVIDIFNLPLFGQKVEDSILTCDTVKGTCTGVQN